MNPISLIVATDENGGIGINGSIPWMGKQKGDMALFRSKTTESRNSSVVMGRKTAESIGKPLPDRENILISRDDSYRLDGFKNCTLWLKMLLEDKDFMDEAKRCHNIWIIGGAEIYNITLPVVDVIHKTTIRGTFGCDTFFPGLSPKEWWRVHRKEHDADEKNENGWIEEILVRHQ